MKLYWVELEPKNTKKIPKRSQAQDLPVLDVSSGKLN